MSPQASLAKLILSSWEETHPPTQELGDFLPDANTVMSPPLTKIFHWLPMLHLQDTTQPFALHSSENTRTSSAPGPLHMLLMLSGIFHAPPLPHSHYFANSHSCLRSQLKHSFLKGSYLGLLDHARALLEYLLVPLFLLESTVHTCNYIYLCNTWKISDSPSGVSEVKGWVSFCWIPSI